MVLAQMRGLLKPYYEHGVRSILAEHTMLRALDAELMSDYQSRFLVMKSSFAPLTNASGAKNMWKDTIAGFEEVVSRAFLDYNPVKSKHSFDSESTVRLLHQLTEAGFFDKLNESTETVLRDIR